MNWMRAAACGPCGLCLLPAAVRADGTEDALLRTNSRRRAAIRRHRRPQVSQAPDLTQVRDQYLNILRQAAASGSQGANNERDG